MLFYSKAYNGEYKELLARFNATLAAPVEQTFTLQPAQYDAYLKDTGNWFSCELTAVVQETEQKSYGELNLDLILPREIRTEFPAGTDVPVHQSVAFTVLFVNPFTDLVLTGGLLQIESSVKFFDKQEIPVPDLAPGASIEMPVSFIPKHKGEAFINIEFDFDQVTDLQSFTNVTVY